MNNNIIFLILYIFFAAIIYLFFFFATKSMFDGDAIFIEFGKRDEEILKIGKKKVNQPLKIVGIVLSTIFCVALVGSSIGLLLLKSSDKPFNYVNYMALAVTSGSMEAKDDKNKYLVENNLNNQFPTGSTIFLSEVPEQKDIKKYDVIAYKNKEGVIVIHRIINFGYYDENNYFNITDDVTKATKFIFRGDNNDASDATYVDYDQFYGYYTGNYIPYVGYFIQYAQSYFGLVSLVAIAAIIESYEFFEKKNRKIIQARYELISGDFTSFEEEIPAGDKMDDETKENLLADADSLESNTGEEDMFKENVEELKTDGDGESIEEDEPLFKEETYEEETEIFNDDILNEESEKPLFNEDLEDEQSFDMSGDIEIIDNINEDKEHENAENNFNIEDAPKEVIKDKLTIDLNEDRESEGIKVTKSKTKEVKHLLKTKLDKTEYIRQAKRDERARKKTIKRFKR